MRFLLSKQNFRFQSTEYSLRVVICLDIHGKRTEYTHTTEIMPLCRNSKELNSENTIFDLLPFEEGRWATMNEGVQILSIYKIDDNWSQASYTTIVDRCLQIFKLNPFLMGSIIKPSTFKLMLKPSKLIPKNFVHEKVIDRKFFSGLTSYGEKCKIIGDFKVPNAGKAFKDDLNLAEFYVLRDNEDVQSAKNIAIILSTNHLIGDGCTMYNIFNMLDPNCQPRTLDRTSVLYGKEIYKHTSLCGKNGKDTMMSDMFSTIAPMLMSAYGRSGNKKYTTQLYNFRINNEELNRVKEEYKDQEFPGSFVSTNDILTSWLFTKNPKADFVQMAVDARKRIPILENDLAGNYLLLAYLRKTDLASPIACRKLVQKRTCNKTGKDYQTMPTFSELRKYCGGISTNWSSFYKSFKLNGLDLVSQTPFFDQGLIGQRFMGMDTLCEDNIIIFKANDKETGVYIFTGSAKISKEDLENDPMTNGRLI